MKRVLLLIAAAAFTVALAGTASAAPKPTNDPLDPTDLPDGNHPAFLLECTGGIFGGDTVPGVVVIANGGAALAHGGSGGESLPTAQFTGADGSVLGVSMYRETHDLTTGTLFDEAARGNKTLDQVFERWNVSTCSTGPLPGFALNLVYPNAEKPFDDTHFYTFTNYVKPTASNFTS